LENTCQSDGQCDDQDFWPPIRLLEYPALFDTVVLTGTLLHGSDDKLAGADPRRGRSAAERDSVDNSAELAGSGAFHARYPPSDPDPAASAKDEAASDRDQVASASDQTASASDQVASERDQTASDRDQTASERDQTASDRDQTASDGDQTASDGDQNASDEDQAASDQESALGADQRVRDVGSVHREHATHLRDGQSRARLRTATSREITADERDEVAQARDLSADIRDAGAQARGDASDEQESPRLDPREEQTLRAARDRRRAEDDRASAANDRARAADERTRAAEERASSARDRTLAARDRAQAAVDREASETDELTHVRRRGAGMEQLQREIDRARRAPEELVVTFIDVDGLKAVNDHEGHLAGDSLLLAVADSLRACLRSYDLVMRFGGDEFVCALPNANVKRVRQRFADVSNALAMGPTKGSITVGFAELGKDDSAEDLIRRADADLLAHRKRC
jgi:diguanylate cyclase (GGDEF)-like protein